MAFGWADWTLFALLIVLSLAIGIITGLRGNKTTEDVLMGGRKMSVFPVTMSIFMSFVCRHAYKSYICFDSIHIINLLSYMLTHMYKC